MQITSSSGCWTAPPAVGSAPPCCGPCTPIDCEQGEVAVSSSYSDSGLRVSSWKAVQSTGKPPSPQRIWNSKHRPCVQRPDTSDRHIYAPLYCVCGYMPSICDERVSRARFRSKRNHERANHERAYHERITSELRARSTSWHGGVAIRTPHGPIRAQRR